MTIAKSFSAKAIVAVVAAAMALSSFAASASAQTTDELQQMINDLLAQVATLQADLGQDAAPAAAGVCPYTWTRDLSSGSTGMDVMKLQQFLNADPDTRVSVEGAGSAGMETEYYGPATAAAVSKMQVKYRADILSPANLVNPTGYFGPSSRAKANMLCVEAPAPVDPVDPGDEDEDEDEEEEEEEGDLQGEGELTKMEIDDEEDTLSEGEEDVPVLRLTLEAEDGDVEIDRLDFTLLADATVANEEDEPWDVFEEVSLWVDGDKVASFDAADQDEWLDEDAGEEELRFARLGLVLREDVETEVLVAVSAMNSVDGSDTANAADWNIEPTKVRYFDADGVASTETVLDEMTAGDDSLHFDIEERGTDDDADIESSSDNPDSATLLVDENSTDSDEFTVHIFEIEVDDESSDLEINDAYVNVTVANPSTNADVTGGQEDVIDSISMTIDGETVDGEATLLGTDNEDDTIASSSNTVVRYLFEFDGDVTLEADETYDVEVTIVLKGQNSNYENGVTVTTSVTGSQWEAEGAEDDNNLSGTDTSETHTLATVVPVVSGVDSEATADDPNDSGTISFEFNVEADGENDVVLTFTDVDGVIDGTADDVLFTVTGPDTSIASAQITKVSGDATIDTGANTWTINDGDDATFALDVTFTTASSADDGTYRVTLDTVEGVEVDETSPALSLSN